MIILAIGVPHLKDISEVYGGSDPARNTGSGRPITVTNSENIVEKSDSFQKRVDLRTSQFGNYKA